jgi:hypothetical protein
MPARQNSRPAAPGMPVQIEPVQIEVKDTWPAQ